MHQIKCESKAQRRIEHGPLSSDLMVCLHFNLIDVVIHVIVVLETILLKILDFFSFHFLCFMIKASCLTYLIG